MTVFSEDQVNQAIEDDRQNGDENPVHPDELVKPFHPNTDDVDPEKNKFQEWRKHANETRQHTQRDDSKQPIQDRENPIKSGGPLEEAWEEVYG